MRNITDPVSAFESPGTLGSLKSYGSFQNPAKALRACFLVRMIFSALVGVIPAQSVLATDFFATQTAGKGQTLTLSPGDTVTVAGANQEGIVATNTGILNASGVTVTTTGATNASGAAAHLGGMLSITNGSRVTTSGSNSYGLLSSAFGSTLTALDVTVETTGMNSHGALAREDSLLILQNSSVTTSGAGAAGLAVIHGITLGSTLIATNSTVSTTGLNGYGILISGRSPLSVTNVVSLNNTKVTTQQGDGINWDSQSNTNISLKNGTKLLPGNGVLLRGLAGTGSGTSRVLNLTADGNVTLVGDVLVGPFSVVNVNLRNNSVLTGAMQNATNVTIETGGQWDMTDSSTIAEDISVRGGVLMFETGKNFAATGEASVLRIGRNFAMDAGSTLSLGIGGTQGEQYDHLQIQGNASLNGTLAVSSLNSFRPSNGDAFEILRTNGARSGEFEQVSDSLNNNPNLQRIDVYAPNGVALVYVAAAPTPVPTPTPPNPTPTPKPRPPIIDVIPTPLPPVNPEEPLPLPLVLSLLDPTAEQLTSLFEISFSGANIQRFNLEDRLAEIQRGSTGFVSHLPTAPSPYEGKRSVGEGKSVVEKQPVFQPTPENRWGVWVNGWGDFVSVDNDNFAKGYDFTTGGVTIGIDYRITEHLAVGLAGSYAHTWTNLQPAGNVDVNTGRFGLYATYFDRGFYVNGAVFGGYNSYDTSRQGLLGLATGNTDGEEFSTFLGAGYDFHFGNFTVGPVASVQYTNVHINGFNEQGSLLPLQIHSDSEESWKTDLGVQASYAWHCGSVLLVPSVRAAWEHEFKYSALPITVSSADFQGVTATFFGPSEGHDSAIINAGLGVQWTPRISTYLGYQGQLGRDHYNSNAVTGSMIFSF